MKLSIDPVKKAIEELRGVSPKTFASKKAARKRWLVTAEDRELFQKAITDRLLADFEKERQLRKGR